MTESAARVIKTTRAGGKPIPIESVLAHDLPREKMPVIPGHQVVGIVDVLGPGCKRLKIGQHVGVAWLRQTCGTCGFCRAGRENLCESARFTGYHADQINGTGVLVVDD